MKIEILGIQIDKLTQTQALAEVENFLNSAKRHQIITANPEIVLSALKNESYQNIINNSSLTVADGVGLLWAAKFLSLKSASPVISLIQALVCALSLIFHPKYCQEVLPARIAGVDLLEKICERASRKGWQIYLLGGEEGIAEKTGEALKKKYLDLKIVGAKEGPIFKFSISNFQFLNNDQNPNEQFQNVIADINQTKPDILFVAFGSPKQDFFISQILHQLTSVKVAMGVGGAFDFISGKAKRAPEIWRELGLEWLHRFIHQPWRAIRIFNATLRFISYTIRFKNHLR
jgi:N-acetylglucosaminyldiphosphoundecaprenol N-acetyl-beta-D-mannosaminyltransferase